MQNTFTHTRPRPTKYQSLKPLVVPSIKNYTIDWIEDFSRQGPLEVEIGFGNGDYLIRRAEENPRRNFIGIEYRWTGIRKGLRKIHTRNIRNVRLVLADARIAFRYLFKPNSLSFVYALFPDPWFKEHHERHRLFSRVFLRLANNRLKNKKTLEIITDDKNYVTWILQQSRTTGFQIRQEDIDPQFGTKYELKWSARGQQKFYKITCTKIRHIPCSLIKEDILKNYSMDVFDSEHFLPQNQHGDVTIIFKDFLYDSGRLKGMVHVVVVEEDLTQEFWIAITKKEKKWHIHLARGTLALPTAGVARAIDLVYQAASKENKSPSLKN
ncbi:MAG: hypothetical protein ABIJ41_02850 [Candidatus Omnitrophota bacterium]